MRPVNRIVRWLPTARTFPLFLALGLIAILSNGSALADHTPQTPSEHVYRVVFTSSGQNVWGPEQDATPQGGVISLLSPSETAWNESGRTSDRARVMGFTFGGSIEGSTAGHVGLELAFQDFEPGEVNVYYPVEFSLTYPSPDSFRPGQKVTIATGMEVQPDASMTVKSVGGDLGILTDILIAGEVGAEVCVFTCVDFPIAAEFEETVNSGLSISSLRAAIDNVRREHPDPWVRQLAEEALEEPDAVIVSMQLAAALELPFSGRFGSPVVDIQGGLQSDGRTLKAAGTHDGYFDVDLDITDFVQRATGLPLNVLPPVPSSDVLFWGSLWNSEVRLKISHEQEVTYTPVVKMQLQFPQPVEWQVVTPAGDLVDSGFGDRVTLDPGNQVAVTVPEESPGTVFDVTPTFFIDDSASNFKNDARTISETSFVNQALQLHMDFPSLRIMPRTCVGSGELRVCSPEVRSPKIDLHLGPVWEHVLPITTWQDSSLMDGNRDPWVLPGVQTSIESITVNGEPTETVPFALDPQYSPVALITANADGGDAPSLVSEGQTLTFSSATSWDPDGDPMTHVWDFGDGVRVAGETISHTYYRQGDYTVTLTVDDGHGRPGIATHQISVRNVAPIVWAGPDRTVVQGSIVNLGSGLFGGNLVVNPGFEDGIDGWTTTGGFASRPYGPASQPSLADLDIFGNNLVLNGGAEALNPNGSPQNWSTNAIRTIAYADSANSPDPGSYPVELVVNGDAESGGGSSGLFPTGWTGSPQGAARVVPYGSNQYFVPSPSHPGPPHRGSNLFLGYVTGDGETYLTLSQIVDVPGHILSDVQTGNVQYNLSAWLGGWENRPDHAWVTVSFRDVNGNVLHGDQLAPVTAADRNNQTRLNQRTSQGTVPAGTRSVEIIIHFQSAWTPTNPRSYGVADNVSLLFTYAGAADACCPPGPGIPETGARFFYGGDGSPTTTPQASQVINLSSIAYLIREGQVSFDLSALLGGMGNQADRAEVSAIFYSSTNGSGSNVGPVTTIGPVTAEDRGNQSTLLFRSASGTVPANAQSVRIRMTMTRTDGTRYDGYVDNISFVLKAPPDLNLDGVHAGGYPLLSSPGAPARGARFGSGGSNNASSTASQLIDVSSAAAVIDAGLTTYNLSAWLGGFGNQDDHARVEAIFKREDGTTIASDVVGPVTAADRAATIGGSTGLLPRSASGVVPAETRAIEVRAVATRVTGQRNDGYVDNVSLVLQAPDGATISDTSPVEVHTATIDWGDGSPVQAAEINQGLGTGSVMGVVLGSHAYALPGTYVVTVSVTDDDGDTGSDSFQVTVLNAPPEVQGLGPVFVNGVPTEAALATFVDPGILDTHTVTIDWGDGSPASAGTVSESDGSGLVYGSHQYSVTGPFPATRTLTVTVTDSGGASGSAQVVATIVDARFSSADVSGPQTIVEGGSASLTGSFGIVRDSGGNVIDGLAYQYAWDFGDGSTTPFAPFTPGAVLQTSHVYQQDGVYTVVLTAEARSEGVLTSTATMVTTVTVTNAAPVVTTGLGNETLVEGGVVSLGTIAFTDAGVQDTHTATIIWGDGTSTTPFVVQGAGGGSFDGGSHVYQDNGTYQGRVLVCDRDGACGEQPFTVTVTNAAPVVDAGGDAAITEGGIVTRTVTFTDPGPVDTHTASIDWGDGSGSQPLAVDQQGRAAAASHSYAQDGTYTVTVTVTDKDGAVGVDTFQVMVANARPQLQGLVGRTVNQATELYINATFTDAGVEDTHTASIDWGDGTIPSPVALQQAAGAGVIAASHVYQDPGTYTVRVEVCDDSGAANACDETTFPVTVRNVAPTLDGLSVEGAGSLTEGMEVVLHGAFSDPGVNDIHTATVDWGDGTGLQPLAVDQVGRLVNGSHVYADDGSYTITVCVSDGDAQSCGTLALDVANAVPTVDPIADLEVDEGEGFVLEGSFWDLGTLDSHTVRVQWGDGTTSQVDEVAVVQSPFGPPGDVNGQTGTFSASHVYADDGVYTVTVTVRDNANAGSTQTFLVTVNNIAPTVDAGPDRTVQQGEPVSLVGSSFSDPGIRDTHTATISWGDGTTQVVDVSQFEGGINGIHTYANPGSYSVEICIEDNGGGVACDTMVVTVDNTAPRVFAGPDVTLDEGQAWSQDQGFDALVYAQDFESGVDQAWSTGEGAPVTTAAPGGQRYLGPFGPEPVTLVLPNLPDHDSLTLTFDLYVIGGWDGSSTVLGPDAFQVDLLGGPTLLNTTFSNTAEHPQAYPDSLDGDQHPAQTGALEVNSLGYVDGDAVYRVTLTLPHAESSAILRFAGVNLGADELWGLDNVTVTVAVAGPRFADPGDEVWTATVDYGDGTGQQALSLGDNGVFALSHVYADNGAYVVAVEVCDSNGACGTGTLRVTVNNAAPTVGPGEDLTAVQGGSVLLQLPFHDQGTLDTHIATIDWGDGSSLEEGQVMQDPFGPPGSVDGQQGLVTGEHVYTDVGTYTVVVRVIDQDGDWGEVFLTVVVENAAPTVTVDAPSVEADEGQTAVNSGTFFDLGQDGVVVTASVGTIEQDNGNSGAWSWSFDATDGPADSQTVTITATDSHGGASQVTFEMIVNNVAPSLDVDAATVTVDQGATAVNSGTFFDPGLNDQVTITANVGVVTQDSGNAGAWSWAYPATDGARSYTVTVTATDGDGSSSEVTFEVVVENVAPTLEADHVSIVVDEGQTASNSGVFFDPGAHDDVVVTASIGDVTQDAGSSGAWSWSLVVPDGPANYSVTITATDDGGASSSVTFEVSVSNVAPSLTVDDTSVEVDGGQTATNGGTFWDPGVGDEVEITASVGVVTQDAGSSGAWFWSFDASNGPADSQLVTITATDNDGSSSSITFDLVVRNVAPSLSVDADVVEVDEGQLATNGGTFSGFSWSNGVVITATVGNVTQDADNSGAWSWTFDTTDGPADSQTVTITATDGLGDSSHVTFSLVVNNVAPAFTDLHLTPAEVTEGDTVTLNGAFADPGLLDGHTIHIAWGDGEGETLSGVVSPFTASHVYAVAGQYTVTVEVSDNDGGAAIVGVPVSVRSAFPTEYAIFAGANVTVGNNASTGDILAGGKVTVGNNARTGSVTQGAAAEAFVLPAVDADPDPSRNVSGGTITLEPGRYGSLTASNNAQVTLRGGEYSFTSMSFANNARITVDLSNGQPLVLRVAGDVTLGNNAQMTVIGGDASRIIILAGGDIKLGNNAVFYGSLVAPDGLIALSNNNRLTGAAWGATVTVSNNSVITHMAFAPTP